MFSITHSRSGYLTSVLAAMVLLSGCTAMTASEPQPTPAADAGENTADATAVTSKAEAATPQAALENTYWKLVSLNGTPILIIEDQREPHLILKQGDRVQGFSGCNQFMGQFGLKDNRLQFGPIATTMRACMPSIDYEHRFLQLLQGEVNWSIDGEQLNLNNPSNRIQASFKAVYLQ